MMSDSNTQLLSTVASLAASVVLTRTVANEFIPHELRNYFHLGLEYLSRHFFPAPFTVIVEEFHGRLRNQVFDDVEAYLRTKATHSNQKVQVRKCENDKNLSFGVHRDEEVHDDFEGAKVKWKQIFTPVKSDLIPDDEMSSSRSELRSYELTFHKKYKEKIFNSYLPYVMERSKAIKQENMTLKIHQVGYHSSSRKFNHPMTFKTLAIDAELKRDIMNDLDRFVKRKDFYHKTGRAWKRGYLLYGPPGTGKSSLIAAMANYLNYDIYDMDLTLINDNEYLRERMLDLSNRSILVIEDIDCSIKLQNREEDNELVDNRHKKITLSGLLNVIDGLWSCCGEERIIVFTTNHKERLDPALLRPGRMDMQIHLSYCSFLAFKQLANNYLGISEHKLFDEIEGLLKQVQVTPAQFAEELTKISDAGETKIADATECLQDLVKFLNDKKIFKEETNNELVINEEEEEEEARKRKRKRENKEEPILKLSKSCH